MADLLRLSSARLPEPADLPAIQSRGLYTHYAPINEDLLARSMSVQEQGLNNLPLEGATISEEARLLYADIVAILEKEETTPEPKAKEKYKGKETDKTVSQRAAEYIASKGVHSLKDLQPLSHIAIQYCGSKKSFLRGGFETTMRIVRKSEDFCTTDALQDLGRLSNTILCGAILHEQPDKLATLIGWWRSLLAVTVGNSIRFLPEPTPEQVTLIHAVFDATLYLPSWVYKLRGCTNPRDKKGKDWADIMAELDKGLHVYQEKIAKYDRLIFGKMDSSADAIKGFCECKCEDRCLPVNPKCVCITPFVTNYYLLKDKIHCYVPADMAYIEVVAAGETKKRIHESKELVETQLETEENLVQKEERDLQVTDRSTLHTEIEKQMQASLDVSAKVSGKIKGQEYEVSSDGKLSKQGSEKTAREVFREAVTKAAYSMQKTTRTLRKERRQIETNEVNKHVFTNTTDKPFITKYFYVNQQRKAQVYDYGMRLIVELIIPSPAELFEALWKERAKFDQTEPLEPNFDVRIEQINADNYLRLGQDWHVADLEAPPSETIFVTVSSDVASKSGSFPLSVTIPQGYEAKKVRLNGTFDTDRAGTGTVDFQIGNVNFQYKEGGSDGNGTSDTISRSDADLDPDWSGGQYTIGVTANNMEDWTATLTLTCALSSATRLEWKMKVFAKLKDAYDASVVKYIAERKAYDEALAEHNEKWNLRLKSRHPFFNRETAFTELKRSSIFMMCQSFAEANYNLPGGEPKQPSPPIDAINRRSEPCGLPEFDRPNAKQFGHEAYFWDRAFDWDLMSYILFDYFWNPMCNWKENFDVDHPDAMFRAFLQAGYARVHVPVAEGMEEDVEWYLLTGQKWGQQGKPPLDASDPRWRSIAQELRLQRGCRQDDRPGYVSLVITATSGNEKKIHILKTDHYLDPQGLIDQDIVDYDISREIYIDMVQYRIVDIQPISGGNGKDWEITLDRKYDGDLTATPFHTVGARFVGAPFLFEVPTDLVWASAHNTCLPCYPVECIE